MNANFGIVPLPEKEDQGRQARPQRSAGGTFAGMDRFFRGRPGNAGVLRDSGDLSPLHRLCVVKKRSLYATEKNYCRLHGGDRAPARCWRALSPPKPLWAGSTCWSVSGRRWNRLPAHAASTCPRLNSGMRDPSSGWRMTPCAFCTPRRTRPWRSLCALCGTGKGDAVVSTGNTGALFTGASDCRADAGHPPRRHCHGAGVREADPAGRIPVLNVTVQPDFLPQFAVMGAAYMKGLFGIEMPPRRTAEQRHRGVQGYAHADGGVPPAVRDARYPVCRECRAECPAV